MISKHSISKIFENAVIEEVVGDFVHLKKSGRNYRALSPFTNEKTPSFYVVPHKGIYKCFSSGKGGNVVNFLMEHEKLSYPEALRWLADKYGIEIEEEEMSEEAKEAQTEREALGLVVDFAQKWFEDQLWNTDDGRNIGLSYFKERGFREQTIKEFGLGYCPDKWDEFTKAALEKGYPLDILKKTGLTKGEEGKYYDFFRGRVIFPIRNISSKNIGFGARTLKTDKKSPKYFNSPESELYYKSKVLYGIDKAKSQILKDDNCFLVEGYTDVISLYQNGLSNVVSSSGTALTEDQIRLIKRFTKNVTVLFDGDAAGIRASFRGINMLLAAGMAVKVVLFPDGEDPDSFAKKVSNSELEEYVKDKAKDFIVFKADLLASETQNDPLKRAEMIRDIIESVSVIPDAIQRSVYIQECSRLFDVEEQSLVFELNKLLRQQASRREKKSFRNQEDLVPPETDLPKEVEEIKGVNAEAQEKELLRILLQYGSHIMHVELIDEELADLEEETIAQEEEESLKELSIAEYIWFETSIDGIEIHHPTLKKMYREYLNFLDEDEFPEEEYFTRHDDPEISSMSAELLTSKYDVSENWEIRHGILSEPEEKIVQTTVRDTIYRLKLYCIRRWIYEVGEELKKEDINEEEIDLLFKRKMKLDKAKQHISHYFGTTIY